MFDAFVLTLRELAELVLTAGALLALLPHGGRPRLLSAAAAGLAVGAGLGVQMAWWLVAMPLSPVAEAILTTALALGVLLMASGMLASARAIRTRTQVFIEAWLEHRAAPCIVFGFAVLVTLREALELTVFLRSIWLRDGPADALAGALSGMLGAACLVVAWRHLRLRLGLLAAFRVSALLLSLLAIEILLAGLGSLLQVLLPQMGAAGSTLQVEALFLEGGRWYGWVYAALMALPLLSFIRGWWQESAVRR